MCARVVRRSCRRITSARDLGGGRQFSRLPRQRVVETHETLTRAGGRPGAGSSSERERLDHRAGSGPLARVLLARAPAFRSPAHRFQPRGDGLRRRGSFTSSRSASASRARPPVHRLRLEHLLRVLAALASVSRAANARGATDSGTPTRAATPRPVSPPSASIESPLSRASRMHVVRGKAPPPPRQAPRDTRAPGGLPGSGLARSASDEAPCPASRAFSGRRPRSRSPWIGI